MANIIRSMVLRKYRFKESYNPDDAVKCSDISDMMKVLEANPDIQHLRILFPDIQGRMCDFKVPITEIDEDSLTQGFYYDGSSVKGHARIHESDMRARPVPATAIITPWTYQTSPSFSQLNKRRELMVFANIYNPDGSRYEGDSRYVLEKAIEKAEKETGMTDFFIGPELEFFLFKGNGMGRPALDKNSMPKMTDKGGYFQEGQHGTLRTQAQEVMQSMGYRFTADHHEVAYSQHEIDPKHDRALETADMITLAKYIIKREAKNYTTSGTPTPLFASFMPKPFVEYEGNPMNGNGMHVHMSLFKGKRNLFYDPDTDNNLSEMAMKFAAGLLMHAEEMSSIVSPSVNSYKRLVPGCEAPTNICLVGPNRTGLVRIPAFEGREKAARFEYRSPDPSANIYLTAAVLLNAGLRGIMNNYQVPEQQLRNIYEMSQDDKKANNIKELPGSLEEALEKSGKAHSEKSSVLSELSETAYENYMADRKEELESYKQSLEDYKKSLLSKNKDKDFNEKETITPWEYENLLPVM